jgi:hypothetical protein
MFIEEAGLKAELEADFDSWQAEIDKLVLKAYGDVSTIEGGHSSRSNLESALDDEVDDIGSGDLARSAISYGVGLAFGRWKSGVATPEAGLPDDPFAAYPLVPSGVATQGQSLYLIDDSMLDLGLVKKTTKALCDAFGPDADVALCVQLGINELNDYLAKPAGFFADHLAVYTKSRRQAPIYWPLSTKSGNFTIWVYYPKLDDQSLPKLITDVLSPKIRTLSQEIENRRATPAGKIGELEELRQELEEMRADFLDLINRGFRPNQNDGVLITACPLAKYFRHAGFRKNLEACWKQLARGDYDWSHLAMSMWPARVLEACKKDRTIAIAHGKEDLCPVEPPMATRGRKKSPPSN